MGGSSGGKKKPLNRNLYTWSYTIRYYARPHSFFESTPKGRAPIHSFRLCLRYISDLSNFSTSIDRVYFWNIKVCQCWQRWFFRTNNITCRYSQLKSHSRKV